MGLLEVKHGLLQLAESLEFLHNNARLVHRAIAPEVSHSCSFCIGQEDQIKCLISLFVVMIALLK